MNKIITYIITLVLSGYLCWGQSDINGNGYNKFYYPNGSIQSEGNLKNGKPDGFWINYYPTGVKKSEGTRFNSELDSIWNFYDIAGNIQSNITYRTGKRNGYSYEYYIRASSPSYIGNIKSKELYVNNNKEGASLYYYEDGSLKESVEYEKNRRNGNTVMYDEIGKVITILKYRKGTVIEREKVNRYNKEKNKVGIWKEFYEGINIRKEYSYRDGLLDGYIKEYDRNGKLLVTKLYRKGELVEKLQDEDIKSKEKIEYYEDGRKKYVGAFIEEKPIGIHKKYSKIDNTVIAKIYSNGAVLLEAGAMDTNGFRNGLWEEYRPNKGIKAKGRYVRSRKHGKWEYYFENSKKEQIGQFDRGSYTGVWNWFYKSGKLWKEEEFYNNRLEGMYVEYSEKGEILVKGEYFDGEKEGEWIARVNDHKAVGKYVAGLMDGKWKYYYDDGSIAYEGSYIQGRPDGKHKYYHPNGSIREEQIYNVGIRQKHWKKYDEYGQLKITISYKDDKEYRINGVKIDLPGEVPKIIE